MLSTESDHWVPHRISEIIALVSLHFQIPRVVLLGKRRIGAIVMARQIAMSLARDDGYSYPQIGSAFQRDHTTILHAHQRVKARYLRGEDRPFIREYQACLRKWSERAAQLDGLLIEPTPAPISTRPVVSEAVA